MTTTSPVCVRQAGEHDTAAVAALRRAWTEEHLNSRLSDDGFQDAFARWYAEESGRRIVLVAEKGATAVGMVNLALFERMPRPAQPAARWGYLGNAFVLPGHRGRGIGTALLTELLRQADELGCVRVVLSPSERSVPFYQRAGFGPATMLMARLR